MSAWHYEILALVGAVFLVLLPVCWVVGDLIDRKGEQ